MDKIKRVQKNLSRKIKGSKNWHKTKLKLIKVYDKLNNQKNDFLHKLLRYYINNYDKIVLEDLIIKSMVETGKGQKTLNRNILSSSWRKFINLLLYKAEETSTQIYTLYKVISGQVSSMSQEALPEGESVKLLRNLNLEISDFHATKTERFSFNPVHKGGVIHLFYV